MTLAASPAPVFSQQTATAEQDAAATEEEGAVTADPEAPPRRGPTDVAELGAFLDGLMAAHRADHDIVGATVAVVRGGSVMLTRGYGWADREAREPVDAERTLFRIGSVSKLFTWTAVMQLVEQGEIDLDADVETYVDFELGAGNLPRDLPPITMRHLMTHTPGFEDRALALFGETELSRRDYLVEHMPARVRPPGTFSAYSNYGTVLAGHVVERISGLSWEDYVDRHILEPLGMDYATAHQPLPERLEPSMSKGYAGTGADAEKEFEMIEGAAPAGSISASAGAMAKFMLAFLQGGRYGDGRILEEETVERMLDREFTHDERLNGFALGFYEKSSHGVRAVGHGGDTAWFHTDMALIPSEDLGVFVSYNTAAGGEVSFGPFFEAFLDHYFPVEPPTFVEADQDEIERIAGVYRFNRGSYTTFEKVMRLASPVTLAAAEGELVLQSPLGAQRFRPVGGGLYRELDGSAELAYRQSDEGKVTHVFLSFLPMMVLERVGGLASPTIHLPLLVAVLAIFLLFIVAFPIRWFLRRRYKAPVEERGERRARLLALLMAIVAVAFAVGLAAVGSSSESILVGETGALRAVLSLGVLAALLTLGVVVAAVIVWRCGFWGLWGRLRYTLVALAGVAFVLILQTYNLLGWRLG
ncbi:MAG TPA: serine hydrolase domain-containing protein [Thermoanaerobaculia bacterium]|nr:serine hydrolase domain-containing protein [Thermoanaerobaculia bacterium]